jgi:hypothetical protein
VATVEIMVLTGRGPALQAGVRRWGPLAVFGVAAVVLSALTGNGWPWLWSLAAVAVLAVLGVRRRLGAAHTAAAGLAVGVGFWLTEIPAYGWVVAAGLVISVAGLLLWRTARRQHVQPGTGVVPAESPAEETIPIPRIAASASPRLLPSTAPARPRCRVSRRQAVAVVALGLAVFASGVVWWQLEVAARAARAQAILDEAHEDTVSRILPHSAGAMMQHLVRFISERDDRTVCFVFSERAAQQFADGYGARDCAGAVQVLADRVSDPVAYRNNAWLPGAATVYGPGGLRLDVDMCDLDVSPGAPGPAALGRLVLETYRGGGYQITSFARC